MRGIPNLLALKMIYDLVNDFQIDLFKGSKRLRNLSFLIDFDEY
jgi:hypothetical protein